MLAPFAYRLVARTCRMQTRCFASAASAAPRKSGPIRGGILGFLLGLSLSGGAAYVYLLDEYQQTSRALLSSVEDLQSNTNKLRIHTQKIEGIEKDLKGFASRAATKDEVERLRNELLKKDDDLNIAHLELKTQVWELGQELEMLKRKLA
ncbi:hypothetical protein HK102_000480 [Quaeritorhiza haematococci]|nr:hypothetical protein HK102_000480 [Quaeritorhiza haematococci]